MNKHVEQMIGRKFGKLTVIAHHSREKGYLCRCDCGGTTIAKTYALKNGRHMSCACGKTADRPVARKSDNEAARNFIYRSYSKAAVRRGYEFDLTKEEFNQLIDQNCHYCGAAPSMKVSWLRGHDEFRYNGIDRKNNAVGYIIENCVPCCDICNNSKSTLSYEQWIEWIERIHRKIQERSTTIPSGSTPKRVETGTVL